MTVGRLELLVELPQLRAHPIEVGGEPAQLVAVRDVNSLGEVTGGDLLESSLHLLDGSNQRPGDGVAQHKRERYAADGEADHDAARRQVRFLAGFDPRYHVELCLVDQLVGEALEAVGKRPRLGELHFATLGNIARPDQLHCVSHDLDEPLVFLPDAAEQLHLVPSYELEPVEVVTELIELPERTVECASVRHEEGRRYAVELTGGVVLELAVGGDLPLELHHVLSAAVDVGEHAEAHGPHGDQEDHDGQEGGQELGVDGGGHASDQSGQPRREPTHRRPSRRSERRSPRNSPGSKRTPRYCTRSTPSPSMREVRKVWSTSPAGLFFT